MFPAPKAATGPQKRHKVNMVTATKVKEGNLEGILEKLDDRPQAAQCLTL